MTYKAIETSIDSGAPVELYEFILQPLSWKYTNYVEDIFHSAVNYVSANIKRSKISQSDEINRSEILITAPRDFEPANRFRVLPSSEPMIVRIYSKHHTDAERILIWQGRVMAASWSGPLVDITCEPVFSSLRRPGFRRYYTYICAHSLYGPKCRVVSETYRVVGNVISKEGSQLEVQVAAQKADGFYSGGFIAYLTPEGLIEQRSIISHTGTSVVLSTDALDLVGGMAISLFPGCNHTIPTCGAKFKNTNNYGGFPYIPTGSPFSGKTLF